MTDDEDHLPHLKDSFNSESDEYDDDDFKNDDDDNFGNMEDKMELS